MGAPYRFGTIVALAAASAIAALAVASASVAARDPIRFVGGSPAARAQVARALAASDYDWNTLHGRVTVHIGHFDSRATPGHVWLDENLLRSGRFAWGVILHEYAHQVDFLLLDDNDRRAFAEKLGGAAWCPSRQALPHDAYTCERFASTFAWSYWPSPDNVMRPTGRRDESAAMPPGAFRRLVDQIV